MKLTPGKLEGLKAVFTPQGVIAAAAMDQRGSLKKALGQHATDASLEEFKSQVTEVLTPHASAILLDPEWGLPASKRRAKNAGPAAVRLFKPTDDLPLMPVDRCTKSWAHQ